MINLFTWNLQQSKPRKKPRGRPRTKNKSRERHNTASEAKLKVNDDKIHHLVTSTLDNPMNEERKESVRLLGNVSINKFCEFQNKN